jgi:hypothetical protein
MFTGRKRLAKFGSTLETFVGAGNRCGIIAIVSLQILLVINSMSKVIVTMALVWMRVEPRPLPIAFGGFWRAGKWRSMPMSGFML